MNDEGVNLREDPFEFAVGIVNLHTSKGTHWAAYINEIYFDGYGCGPPQYLSEFNLKRNGHFSYSEYKIQGLTKKYLFCNLLFIYNLLDKVLRIDFKSAVLNL